LKEKALDHRELALEDTTALLLRLQNE